MLEGYSPIIQALIGTLFTWGLTAAGAALVFVFSSHQWIVNAWASTVVRAFRKAGIVTEMPDNTSDTDPDDDFDETEPAMLDAVFAQLFNSDTEEEEFEGFLDEE
ncbi:Zinc transporter ZIP11 [Takifugu flavidus]|uniref:Zinc transporter ZIP11 n=1 Tax=Takifugu flavidus TaxID=433684 RepID=A0A5C6PRR6_9TELE|nr:Zinc transporter ZIP11 [Takifugu flavidus]